MTLENIMKNNTDMDNLIRTLKNKNDKISTLSNKLQQMLNDQINMELSASYFYLAAARYFERHDVALHNVSKFFLKQSDEEKEHSNMFQEFLIMRGGNLVFKDIKKPISEFKSILSAMNYALEFEIEINNHLLLLHEVASDSKDPQLSDFLEGNFLKEQVESIKEFSDYITNLNRVGPGLGEFLFDKHFS